METQSPNVFGESNVTLGGETDIGTQGKNVGWVQAPAHLARSWAVTLAAPNIGVGSLGFPVMAEIRQAFAIIEWGLGGFRNTVEVDWRAGCVMQFYGTTVRVASFVPLGSSIAGPRSLSELRLGASISPQQSGPNYPIPTRTRYLGDVLPGTITPTSIPVFARTVKPCFRVDSLAEPWQLEFFENVTPICVFDGRNFLPSDLFTIEVPPTATSVGFRNLNAVPPPPADTFFDVNLIFQLGI